MIVQSGNQYKNDIFNKLDFPFIEGKNILDVGCGDGSDSNILKNDYRLKTYAIDISKHKNINNIKGLLFKKGSILKIPFDTNYFDYVFTHDVLHHIDEKNQNYEIHIKSLRELHRVCKKGGSIIILEANRYNPLFYPHMVLMHKHNHFRQSYFKKLIKKVFPCARYNYFEAHYYPSRFLGIFKIYEYFMEQISLLKSFLAYNVAIIENDK